MKTVNKYSLIIIFLCFSISCFGQLQNANWYFGNGAGLNFNGTTSVLTNGQTQSASNHSAGVSDYNGNILFYTDGQSVWNKNHLKMPNGNNTLNGAFHTVSIVPFPDDNNKYYIFTISVDIYNQSDDYYYTIVDLSLNNNLGDLVTVNTSLDLLPYVNYSDPAYPVKRDIQRKNNMVVAKHSDGESYWLILNPFDDFFALKIDANGISAPIQSNADGNYSSGNYYGRSGISISPSMDRIAYYTNIQGLGLYNNYLSVYDFDNSTGVFTHSFRSDDWNIATEGYDTEFSSNGRYLSILAYNGNYNIYQADTQNINNNPILIGSSLITDNGSDLPTIARGIDDKIYIPNGNSFLGVINNPNLAGISSNYVNNQINLGSNFIARKLPQQVQFHILSCPLNLLIHQNTQSNSTDIQQASNSIVAINKIESGTNAEYNAGVFLGLQVGFHAKSGSTFKAFIDGCTDTSGRNTNVITKLQEIKKTEESLSIYPNPVNDKLNITIKDQKLQSYELYDINGRMIKTCTNIKSQNHTIDVNSLEKGIYIIKISLDDNSIINRNIIIE